MGTAAVAPPLAEHVIRPAAAEVAAVVMKRDVKFRLNVTVQENRPPTVSYKRCRNQSAIDQ